jgi:hypothetical protein
VTEKSGNRPQGVPERLILDLIGPFVVHFCNGIARIHAPLCLDHHANILTDSNDISLYGLLAPAPSSGYPTGFTYELSGPDANGPRAPKGEFNCLKPEFCLNASELLVLNKVQKPIDAKLCHLLLRAPRPNRMIPLHAEQIWIHRRDSDIWVNTAKKSGPDSDIVDESRARGLRFIYSACSSVPDIQLVDCPKSTSEDAKSAIETELDNLNPDARGFDPKQYHITLRFASNSTSPDEYHEDAYDCFHEMRRLIPETLRWRVDFDELVKKGSLSIEHHGGSNPVDCGALIMAVPESV